jgi:mannitol-specific phosphotransferase system IIBC component
MNVLEKRPTVISNLAEEEKQSATIKEETVCNKEVLPTAIIIRVKNFFNSQKLSEYFYFLGCTKRII